MEYISVTLPPDFVPGQEMQFVHNGQGHLFIPPPGSLAGYTVRVEVPAAAAAAPAAMATASAPAGLGDSFVQIEKPTQPSAPPQKQGKLHRKVRTCALSV